jgi:hypothetical protein
MSFDDLHSCVSSPFIPSFGYLYSCVSTSFIPSSSDLHLAIFTPSSSDLLTPFDVHFFFQPMLLPLLFYFPLSILILCG